MNPLVPPIGPVLEVNFEEAGPIAADKGSVPLPSCVLAVNLDARADVLMHA